MFPTTAVVALMQKCTPAWKTSRIVVWWSLNQVPWWMVLAPINHAHGVENGHWSLPPSRTSGVLGLRMYMVDWTLTSRRACRSRWNSHLQGWTAFFKIYIFSVFCLRPARSIIPEFPRDDCESSSSINRFICCEAIPRGRGTLIIPTLLAKLL